MVVYKYKLDKTFIRQTIEMPSCAEIISAVVFKSVPYLYAIIDTDIQGTLDNRTFQIVPTGEVVSGDDFLGFIGTFKINSGVFHVFKFYPD